MAFINYTSKTLAIKIVYYGPGLSGKTTNLRYIHSMMDQAYRGDLICLETPIERTLFFDLLPIKAGLIHEFTTHFQLLTVPGQVFYDASRRSVLKGADGLVFVADSQVPLIDANLENFDGLRKNMEDFSMDINRTPLVFQYNKRDLDNLIPVETFNNLLNPQGFPFVESAAVHGDGVFETLKEISKLTVPFVREKIFGEKRLHPEKPAPKPAVPPVSKEDIDFVSSSQSEPIRVTRIKFKSQRDIEKEVESLAREFTDKLD